VLAIMAGFQLWRGAWVDGAVFGLLVAVLVIDNQTDGRIHLLRRLLTAPRWVILAITAGLGVFLVLAPRHSWLDLLGMVAIGITVLLLAWVPDPVGASRPPNAIRRSLVLWSVLGVALCLWEAGAFILSTRSAAALQEYPTVSILLDPFVESPIGRTIVVTLWLLGGLGLLRVWSRP
jgi:hypothetical protein